MTKKFGSAFLLVLLAMTVWSNSIFRYQDHHSNSTIGSSIEIYEDAEGTATLYDVLSDAQFVKSEKNIPNLGMSSSSFWVKFTLENGTQSDDLLLLLEESILDRVDFYYPREDGTYACVEMGKNRVFSSRKYNTPNYVFDLNIGPGETQTYFLNVSNSSNLHLPLLIGTKKNILERINSYDQLFGIYIGLMLVMILYNFFIFTIIREKSYLMYILYMITVLLTQTILQGGYAFQFIWPNCTWLALNSPNIISVLVGMTAVEFMKSFLNSKQFVPKLHRIIPVFHCMYLVALIISFFGLVQIGFLLIEVTASLLSIYMIIIANQIRKKGSRAASFFLIAWSFFLASVTIYVFKDFGILPYNWFTKNSLVLGSGLEAVLLSLALGDKINTFRKEKEEAQNNELKERMEKNRLLENQNTMLTIEVDKATKQLQEKNTILEDTNHTLNDTLKQLKSTQIELVQAEKLASLGKMAAGVAHEINNPINIINQSMDALSLDFKDLRTLLDKYESLEGTDHEDQGLLELHALKEELNLTYLYSEIGELIHNSKEGVRRTAEITGKLKIFSQLDHQEIGPTHIEQSIDSMLDMTRSSLLGAIRLQKNYGETPVFMSNTKQFNQVLLILFENSVEAIKEKYENEQDGLITISTGFDGSFISIRFEDNGIGMTPEVMDKACDPFFTTKPIGKSKGLGLSIAYSVLTQHNGQLLIESTQGKGSTVTMKLPFNKISD